MDDDWDLHAVVRECAAAFSAATTTTAAITTNPPPSFPSQNSFTFTGLLDETDNNDPFVGLPEIYQDFCLDDPPPPTVIAAPATIPAPHVFQEIAQMEPPPPPPLQMNLQIQENVRLNNPITLPPPPQIFPAAIPQPTRQRRRKNQHLKMVRQMTQEELSADSWAWRKYGQKPIKGSSFPRNYYRCSTSKGCAARKQVERSQNDPGIFVVSYTGDHTHPRPTHRNSLAGSTRPKFSSPHRNNALLFKTGSVNSSSSAATGSSFSPSTPSMEAEAAAQNDDVEMAEDDDMFKGFHIDSDDHDSSGGGDLFSGGLLSSPPWSPPSNAAA